MGRPATGGPFLFCSFNLSTQPYTAVPRVSEMKAHHTMRQMVPKQLKAIPANFLKWITLMLLAFVLSGVSLAQSAPETISLELRANEDGDELQVYVRSNGQDYVGIPLIISYAIKWPIGTGASLGTPMIPCPGAIPFQEYSIPDNGVHHYSWFASEGSTPLIDPNGCPDQIWESDDWQLIHVIPVLNADECVPFTIATDAHAQNNNAVPYMELADETPIAWDYCEAGMGCSKILTLGQSIAYIGDDPDGCIIDCQGVPGGQALPGTPCDDSDQTTINDQWTVDCDCVGDLIDCLGVPGGPALPGTPCDDGNPNTTSDIWNNDCDCIGVPAPPYLIFINGHINGCTSEIASGSVTITTIQGTQPQVSVQVPLNGNCYYNTSVQMTSLNGWFQVTGNCMNGTSVFNTGQYNFMNGDTIVVVDLDCGPPQEDCNGVPGGSAYFDNCDDCVGGNTGLEPCEQDCAGTWGGPALPGTPCDDGNPMTNNDTWTTNCACVGEPGSGNYTITLQGSVSPCTQAVSEGVVVIQSVGVQPPINLTAQLDDNCGYSVTFDVTSPSGFFALAANCMDGTMAAATGDYTFNVPAGSTTITVDLECINNVEPDCLGNPGGTALPGTPCDDENPFTINDTWTADCDCIGVEPGYCEAGFWVLQGYENGPNNQPVPTPYELWIWNLSTGSGSYQFMWDFGDGTSSSQPFPTHVYSGTGPYVLCLTITDDTGCTDTYCDTISVNNDGIYDGMWTGGDDRSVLTIHVQQGAPSSVGENAWDEGILLWPNPANELVHISLAGELQGNTNITILDLEGRLIRSMTRNFARSKESVTIPVNDLANGLYMIRIENEGRSSTHRFVKNQ